MNNPASGTVSELLPCPFCGDSQFSKVDMTYMHAAGPVKGYRVKCGTCGAQAPDTCWNSRANHSEQTLDMVRPAEQQQEPALWVHPAYLNQRGAQLAIDATLSKIAPAQIPLYRHPPTQQRTEEQERAEFEPVGSFENFEALLENISKTWLAGAELIRNRDRAQRAEITALRAALDTGAVKLPERRPYDGLAPSAENIKAGAWNACLDEVARLNGVRS